MAWSGQCGVWCRGGPQPGWVPIHAGISLHVPSRFPSTLGGTSPGPCKAKCRAAGKAPCEHMRNLWWHTSRGRRTRCPGSGYSKGMARGRTSVRHILGARIRATLLTQGVRPAWLSGSLRRAGAGAVLWRVRPSQSPWGISADMATWQDALMKNT